MGSELIIRGKERDLGGFSVHRTLPDRERRSVGPFVFLDHMGPLRVDETHFLDVRPHPHIGLATVTYLFTGRGFHRDSIGSKQEILPGDLNWMVSGRGIVHSERSLPEDRRPPFGKSIHGVQIWVALPIDQEECEPSFTHWPKAGFPAFELPHGIQTRLLLGEHGDKRSPVPTPSRTLFLDCEITQDTQTQMAFNENEIAVEVISGHCEVDGHSIGKSDMIIVANPREVTVNASAGTCFVVIGGTPFPEPRHIWWNFVSSRKERIRIAAQQWEKQQLGQVEGDQEFIPLPDTPLP